MIIIKNTDDTVSVLLSGVTMTTKGDKISYGKLITKQLIVKGAEVTIDFFRGESIRVIGDAILEIGSFRGNTNLFIDTAETTNNARVVVNGIPLNLKKRNDLFNVSRMKNPLKKAYLPYEETSNAVHDEEVKSIMDQMV